MMTAYGMLFIGLTVLALCAGLLVLGLFVLRDITHSGRGQAPASCRTGQGPQVLAEQYAREEITTITTEQYEHSRLD
jgi:uncharacterized membrane protein